MAKTPRLTEVFKIKEGLWDRISGKKPQAQPTAAAQPAAQAAPAKPASEPEDMSHARPMSDLITGNLSGYLASQSEDEINNLEKSARDALNSGKKGVKWRAWTFDGSKQNDIYELLYKIKQIRGTDYMHGTEAPRHGGVAGDNW